MSIATQATPVLTGDLIKRFEAKIAKSDGCWLWTGAKNSRGYGTFSVATSGKRRTCLAHRLSWATANNTELLPDVFSCHRCDVPLCVNPDHLFAGSHADNMLDARLKGRWATSPRCRVCWGLRRESWVIGNQVMCAACFQVKSKQLETVQIIPLHRLIDAKQLSLFAEAA